MVALTTTDAAGAAYSSISADADSSIQIVKDGSGVAAWRFPSGTYVMSSAICFIDMAPTAAAHTYKLAIRREGGSGTVTAQNLRITAYEL